MTEEKIVEKALEMSGHTGRQYPENDLYLVPTRRGAKLIERNINATQDYDEIENPNAADLRRCLFSYSDASFYGLECFRWANLNDLRKMDIVRNKKGTWYTTYSNEPLN